MTDTIDRRTDCDRQTNRQADTSVCRSVILPVCPSDLSFFMQFVNNNKSNWQQAGKAESRAEGKCEAGKCRISSSKNKITLPSLEHTNLMAMTLCVCLANSINLNILLQRSGYFGCGFKRTKMLTHNERFELQPTEAANGLRILRVSRVLKGKAVSNIIYPAIL